MSDLNQNSFLSVASNESQITLVTLVSDEHEEDSEGVPLPEEEPIHATPVTSQSSPKSAPATQKESQRMRCSQVKAIVICLVATSVVLVVGISVPVLFYYLLVGQGAMLFRGREPTNSSIQVVGCLPVVYRGSFCRDILESYQNGFFRNESVNGQIFITSVVDQEATEQLAMEMTSNLSNAQQNFSAECKDQAKQLICSYLFGLCIGNGTLHLPTAEQCMATNDICMSDQESSTATGSDAIDCSNVRNLLECREDFYLGEEGLCMAECGKFEYWPHHIEDTFNIAFTAALAIGTTIGMVVIAVSCIQHKKLLKFPSVIFVYMTITVLLFEFTLLLGRIDQTALFCSSMDLEQSLRNPTAFCSFTGMASTMYIPMQMCLWVFFYIVSIFWGLKFPFHYQSYQTNGRLRYVHAGMIISSIFLPLIPALLPFGVHGYGYSIRVPPNFCTPVDSYIYVYPVALPIAILVLSSFILLLNVFWIVGNLKLHQKKTGRKSTLTTPEAKILFLISILLFGTGGLIISLSFFLFKFKETTELLIEYLDCESSGTLLGMECDRIRSEFEDTRYPLQGMNDLSAIGGALFPLFFLIYVVPFQAVKKWLKACCSKSH